MREAELTDWKDNRHYRVLALDHGLLSWVDVARSQEEPGEQSGALSLVQISPDTVLSLVQIPPDTGLSSVQPYYAGAKVYAITTHIKCTLLGAFCAFVLLWRDKWLPCTERIYYRRLYAIKNQRKVHLELVL